MEIPSPVMGVVKEILVAPGEAVAEGQEVMILESMKMEMPVESEFSGIVREITTAEGQPVMEGASLMVLE